MSMKIERIWAMPNSRTFTIPPIKRLLEDETIGGSIIDPFPFPFKTDALEYLKSISSDSVENVRFDPPYSQRQLREMYDNAGLSLEKMNNGYWSECRKEIARITKIGGKVISFGWNSNGIGKGLGFEIIRILLVAHGSQHNDTICVVEKKVQSNLTTMKETDEKVI
jgi:hypothetical protein